jgi:hypothetical protein
VPHRVPVEQDQQQPERRERLGGAGEPPAPGDRGYRQQQCGDRREDGGPAAESEGRPRDRDEDDGGAAEQDAAEGEEHGLHGPRGRLGPNARP